MLRSAYERVATTVSHIPAILKQDGEEVTYAQADPENPHVVQVRDGAKAEYIDVRSIEGVTWDEEAEKYKVEYSVPPTKRAALDANPAVQAKLNVEARPDGMYLTQHTESAEAAHAISRFIKLLWEDRV